MPVTWFGDPPDGAGSDVSRQPHSAAGTPARAYSTTLRMKEGFIVPAQRDFNAHSGTGMALH